MRQVNFYNYPRAEIFKSWQKSKEGDGFCNRMNSFSSRNFVLFSYKQRRTPRNPENVEQKPYRCDENSRTQSSD